MIASTGDCRDRELTAMRVAASPSAKPLELMTCAHALLRSELHALHSSVERLEGVLQEFIERICNGYRVSMRTHTTSYRNLLID